MIKETRYMAEEEVRHACTNHYKFSALMSLRSYDNVQPNTLALVVVIRARMSDLLSGPDFGKCMYVLGKDRHSRIMGIAQNK